MNIIKELPFDLYEGSIVKKTHVLEDSCVVWDALNGPSELAYWDEVAPKERKPLTIIPAGETVTLVTSADFGTVIWNGHIVGKY